MLEVLFHKKELTVQSVCEKTLMPNSSMTYVLDKLAKRAYISRKQDDKDKRIYSIALTQKGLELAYDIFPKHYQAMKSIFDVLTQEEQLMMQTLLKKIGYHAKESLGK